MGLKVSLLRILVPAALRFPTWWGLWLDDFFFHESGETAACCSSVHWHTVRCTIGTKWKRQSSSSAATPILAWASLPRTLASHRDVSRLQSGLICREESPRLCDSSPDILAWTYGALCPAPTGVPGTGSTLPVSDPGFAHALPTSAEAPCGWLAMRSAWSWLLWDLGVAVISSGPHIAMGGAPAACRP